MLAEAFRNQLTRSAARRPHPAYRTLSQKPPQRTFSTPYARRTPAGPPTTPTPAPPDHEASRQHLPARLPHSLPSLPVEVGLEAVLVVRGPRGARARSRARGAATPARARVLVAADLARSQQRPDRPSFCLLTLMLTLASRFYFLSSR